MKKVLLSGALFLLVGLVTKINAQNCELGYSDFKILEARNPQTTTVNGQTRTSFIADISFNVKYNENAKRIYIHTFQENDFKDFFDCNSLNNPAPTSAVLGTAIDQPGMSIYDLAIDNNQPRGDKDVPVPVSLLQTYAPDPDVELASLLNSPNITITKAYTGLNNTDIFIVRNMLVYINDYNPNGLNFKSLVWSNDGTTDEVQCSLCPPIVPINAPFISGNNSCRNFSLSITSTNPEERIVTCEVFVDLDKDGVIDDSDPLVKTITDVRFTGSEPFSVSNLNYDNNPEVSGPLVIRIKGDNFGPYLGVTNYDNTVACGLLPVTFKSFTALRNKQRKDQVQLKWETEKEQNNSGFYVQSRTTGEWKNTTFIPSKAENGNSSSVLAYEYTDANKIKGVTQYRLMQVDLDKKTTYSEVKAVIGNDQGVTILVYPNPSIDGTVNVVFNNPKSINDVIVSDITGRIVKHYPHVSNNNLTIEGLISGFYTIKVTDRSTSVSSVEKVVVK